MGVEITMTIEQYTTDGYKFSHSVKSEQNIPRFEALQDIALGLPTDLAMYSYLAHKENTSPGQMRLDLALRCFQASDDDPKDAEFYFDLGNDVDLSGYRLVYSFDQ